MATRSAMIPTGVAVDITAALTLETGHGYLIELGPSAQADDAVWVANAGDPNDLECRRPSGASRHRSRASNPPGERGSWFARFYAPTGRETQLTATEADDCD